MKIILLQDLNKNGKTGEIIEVKKGFARNYLFPNNIAILANKKNISFYEQQKKVFNEKNDIMRRNALNIKQQIESLGNQTIDMEVSASREGKLYSTVTPAQISSTLKDKYNIFIDAKMVKTKDKIKSLGVHQVSVTLFIDINATINVQLIAQQCTR